MTFDIPLMCIALALATQAEESKQPPPQPPALPAKPDVQTREPLEAEFKNMLENATLEGSWQMTQDGLDGREPLTEPKT